MTYSFIYSPRKDTPAAAMECQIPDNIKGERMNRLLETQNAIALEKNKPMEDKIIKVLCDGPSKSNEAVYSGRSEGNKIVLFDGDENDIGKFVSVRVTRAETFALYGEKIDKQQKHPHFCSGSSSALWLSLKRCANTTSWRLN